MDQSISASDQLSDSDFAEDQQKQAKKCGRDGNQQGIQHLRVGKGQNIDLYGGGDEVEKEEKKNIAQRREPAGGNIQFFKVGKTDAAV